MQKEEKNKEKVNHPNHYNQGKIEVIDIIEDWGLDFHYGNMAKYILRAPHKNNEIEDLKKAKWYLERKLSLLIKKRNKESLEFARSAVKAYEKHRDAMEKLK